MSLADKTSWGTYKGKTVSLFAGGSIEGKALVSLLLKVGYVQPTGAFYQLKPPRHLQLCTAQRKHIIFPFKLVFLRYLIITISSPGIGKEEISKSYWASVRGRNNGK